MKTFFITGTGTEVGKTIATAGLALNFVKKGLKTAVMKPVQTGTDDGSGDLETINEIVPELIALPEKIASPYRFPLPASPHLAAECAKTEIKPEKIISSYREIANFAEIDVLLIEGAGGIFVPLTHSYTILDLIKELHVPLILVSLCSLGTINHSLLSIHTLKSSNLDLAGIIFNSFTGNDGPVENDNLKIIPELGRVPVIATIPRISPQTPANFAKELDTVSFNLDV